MSYTALYRKFRPDTFQDVKGQEHIVTTLQNQIKAERIGHAYLFTGTRGTGKTTVAKIFAKTVNCEHPINGNPCGECATCKAIASGASMNVIEIDAASNNGVDNIREIVDEVSYSPAQGKYKVYIIDEVHMLSIGAFNALLKTLEEPPSYVIFILATTEVHKIPITILSRCQRYDFRRISIDTIKKRLEELMKKEEVDVEDKALRYIAKMADGSLRDALSLLDQCIAFHLGQTLTYDKVLDVLGAVDTRVFSELLRNVLKRDVPGCIDLLEEIVMQGRELTQFVTDFTWYLRNLMLVKSSENMEEAIDISKDNLALLKEEAQMIEIDQILRYIRVFSELSGQIRYASQKRILIEMTLIKLCKPSMEKQEDALLDRVRAIEEQLKNGSFLLNNVSDVKTQEKQTIKRPPMPEAVPEDVENAVKKWSAIVENTASPMKIYLKDAEVSMTEDKRLLVALVDGIGSDYFLKNNEHIELLQRVISDYIEKEMKIEVRAIESKESFQMNFPDLRKFVSTEVEEEN